MPEPVHRHEIRVRYGEVDLQGVVFNAHYLAYFDDAFDHWLRQMESFPEGIGWEPMLKKTVVEWFAPATVDDVVVLDVWVDRWGTTSFDVAFVGRVRDERVVEALTTYVGVTPEGHEPIPPPPVVRTHLGGVA